MPSKRVCRECGKAGCYRCVPPDRAPMPSERVEEAREAVLAFNGWHMSNAEARVDTLIAAVRAEVLAEAVGELTAMRREVHSAGNDWDSTLKEAVSRLAALAQLEAK